MPRNEMCYGLANSHSSFRKREGADAMLLCLKDGSLGLVALVAWIGDGRIKRLGLSCEQKGEGSGREREEEVVCWPE